MTIDSRTPLSLAVRYRDHGSDIDSIQHVADADEQADALYDLLADKGIVGEPVEIHMAPGPRAIRDAVARQFVLKTVNDLVDGERTIPEVCDMVRPLCPDLLGDDEVNAITRVHGQVSAGCVLVYRVEQLADAVESARDLLNGLADPAGRDLDAEGRQYEFLINVLAGIEHHSGTGHPCRKHATPAEKSEAA